MILLQDVAKIGKRSDVVDVPDGYAMNQLIPKRMAEPATAQNQKRVAKLQADAEANRAADRERFEKAQAALAAADIKIPMEVNEVGHLFKAVSEKDIAEAAQAAGIDADEAMIQVGNPIKEVGEHTVKLIRGDESAEFTIEVTKKEE